MARFGLNPHGEPLYRIIFAPSRRYLVVGEWPDGSNCAQWCKLYPELGDIWVMEKWLPAEKFAKCTREQWNRENLVLGPFPERGDYEICHSFEVSGPEDANLDKLVWLIEHPRSLRDVTQWHREDAQKEIRKNRSTAEDMIRNRLPAYGCRPFAGGKASRGSKTAPLLLTAEQAGLPTRAGMRTKPNPPQQAA